MQRSNVQGMQRYRFDAALTTSRRDTIYAYAHDLSNGQDVLVTRLPIRPFATETERDALLVRASLMIAVTTPLPAATTPGLHDAFIDGDGLYLVSASAPDLSLRTVIETGRMNVATAARLGIDVLTALESAHRLRLIHGALDPDSVHVTVTGGVKLRGFGINGLRYEPALISVPSTESGFDAPELVDELPTEATDRYGLGALLYFAIEGNSPGPAVIDAADDSARSLRALGPLAGVVRQLLSRDPGRRPDGAEIARTLTPLAGPARFLPTDLVVRTRGDRSPAALAALLAPPPVPESEARRTPPGRPVPAAQAPSVVTEQVTARAAEVDGPPVPAGPWDAPPPALLGLFDDPATALPDPNDVPVWKPSSRTPEQPPAPVREPVPAPEEPWVAEPWVPQPAQGLWTPAPAEPSPVSEEPAPALEKPWVPAPARPWDAPVAATERPWEGPVPAVTEPRRTGQPLDMPLVGDAPPVQSYVLAPPNRPVTPTRSADDAPPRISRRALLRIGAAVVVAGGATVAGIELFGGKSSTTASPPSPGPSTGAATVPSANPTTPGPTPGTLRWAAGIPLNLYLRPFVVGDLVIASGDSVQAIRISDGSAAWSLPGARRHMTEADEAIVGIDGPDGAHRLLTLNPQDGSTTGSVPLSTAVLGIAVANGVAYIIGGAHALDRSGSLLQAVDVTSGAVLWSNPIELNLSNSPVLDDTSVYVAGPSGVLAYDLSTGQQTWRNSTALGDGTQRSVRSAADGLISTRGADGVYTLAKSDGHLLWSLRDTDVPYLSSENSLANGIAYVSGLGSKNISGRIRALDEHTGTLKWTFNPSDGRSRAVVAGDVVYSTGTTSVVALDAANGTPLWRYRFSGANAGLVEPVIADGVVIVPTEGGHLNALETGNAGG